MDLKLKAFTGAVHLIGVIIMLRRMYQVSQDTPEPIKIALSDLERREALNRRMSEDRSSRMRD